MERRPVVVVGLSRLLTALCMSRVGLVTRSPAQHNSPQRRAVGLLAQVGSKDTSQLASPFVSMLAAS